MAEPFRTLWMPSVSLPGRLDGAVPSEAAQHRDVPPFKCPLPILCVPSQFLIGLSPDRIFLSPSKVPIFLGVAEDGVALLPKCVLAELGQ